MYRDPNSSEKMERRITPIALLLRERWLYMARTKQMRRRLEYWTFWLDLVSLRASELEQLTIKASRGRS
jgi:hypothetical protein